MLCHFVHYSRFGSDRDVVRVLPAEFAATMRRFRQFLYEIVNAPQTVYNRLMTENSERLKQILAVVATVGVLIINYLAAVGYLGGVSPSYVSDLYPTLITPAGYAFAIWSLIYFGLLAFSVYQALPSQIERFRRLRSVYILSCAANCAWLYAWYHQYIAVALGIIFLLLGTLSVINSRLRETASAGEFWLAKFPFGLYFGWVTAAAILNTTITLIYLDFQISAANAVIAGAGLLLIAATLGALIRFRLNNPFYPLAVAWALTAIAVKQSGATLIVAAAAVGVIVCLLAALSFLITTNKTADE